MPTDRPRGPLPTRVTDLPSLGSGYHVALERGLDALGLQVPPDAREAIDGHVRLLLAWTQSINLTAIRDPVAAATLHVVDSLAAAPVLRVHGISRVLDLGSGGGFPGIPLAAAMPADTLLVESIGKKAGFLRTAVEAIGLADRVAVEAARAETLGAGRRDREAWPAVVARAVSSLAELAELAFPLIAVGGVLVAWKREPLREELGAARGAIRELGGAEPEVLPVTAPGLETHRLVVVRKERPTPSRYPRPPAERRRGTTR